MTLRIILISIQSLLASPDPTSPQDYQVAKVYMDNHDEYMKEARLWTSTYADTLLEDYLNA
jgi:ubiquitin-protein ligase